ncbi:uncharacterized protein LOC119729728 isoform X1 [Patiria miniata]|uniref:Death domain-containing protein n=1 Tax=Patiria miniata TaxID=46514 RepID=A0A914A4Q6_PATMI|nr:uncharacterized protein LOC119729728 isoform X1 [Patiria miniata]XP_038058366.1 uncharacterized protein LOC119729728 isoform X1 [Patiria miniata]
MASSTSQAQSASSQNRIRCEQFFRHRSHKLSTCWQPLATHCEFNSDEIKTIKIKYADDPAEQAFQFLCALMQRNPNDWPDMLMEGLEQPTVGRRDVLADVEEFLRKGTKTDRKNGPWQSKGAGSSSGRNESKAAAGMEPDRKNGPLQSKGAGSSSGRNKAMMANTYERPPREIKAAAVTREGIYLYCEHQSRRKGPLKRLDNGSWYFWACLTCKLPDKWETILTQFFMNNEKQGIQVFQNITDTSSSKLAKLTCLLVMKPEQTGKDYQLKFNEHSCIYM